MMCKRRAMLAHALAVLTFQEPLAGSDMQEAAFVRRVDRMIVSTRERDSLRGTSAMLSTHSLTQIGMKLTVEKRTKNVELVGLLPNCEQSQGEPCHTRSTRNSATARWVSGPSRDDLLIHWPKMALQDSRALPNPPLSPPHLTSLQHCTLCMLYCTPLHRTRDSVAI